MKNYCENCEHEFQFGEEILVFKDKFVFCGDGCFIDYILDMGIERKVWEGVIPEVIKARAIIHNLDGTERESFDININLDSLSQNVTIERTNLNDLRMSPAEYEMAMERKSESMMLQGLRRFLKGDEALKPTVENGGNQPL